MEKNFPKLIPAPIIEAVLCVDLVGLIPLTSESAVALMQMVSGDYTKANDIFSRSLVFDMAKPEKTVSQDSQWNGMQFKSGSQRVVALMNLDSQIVRMSYSLLPVYSSWKEFSGEGRELIGKFVSAQRNDPIVKRIGIRFINRMKVPEPSCPISDVFLTAPSDPVGIDKIVSGDFLYKETACYGEYDLNATVIRCSLRNPKGGYEVAFDVDVFDNPEVEMSKIDWVSFLDRAHGLKNALFFGSVAEKMYKGLVQC